MWAHAVLVNEFAAGGKVFCGGESRGGSIGKRYDTLHGSLAKGGLADEERPTEVLERPGDDLRSARTRIVRQDDEGIFPL
jgi:hypothetical protein